MWLDSGRPHDTRGCFDILVSDPVATLVTRGAVTWIERGGQSEESTDDPLTLVQRELARHPAVTVEGLPFAGGAVGYFAYDLGRRFENLPSVARDVGSLPEMAVGIYDGALIVDHERQRCYAVGAQPHQDTSGVGHESLRAQGALDTSLDLASYATAFARVQDYIAAGDCYQVNLARRFALPVTGNAFAGYRALRALSVAPFGAYLNTPFAQVLSVSPERFLHVRHGRVETKPIKGTRPRHADPEQDRRLAQELLHSSKDRAENVMIVDLLRNDLGKVCEFGSVRTDVLCALESYTTVHHLVSTVSGEVRKDRHALDVLRACFPGGSITGAPKIRAMQIIEELEGERRGVYCGAVGYIGFDGAMDMNVAIRTLTIANGEARFWAGGGIVADSTCDAEYAETLTKASAMLKLFGLDENGNLKFGAAGGI